jgi:hypothetical protein
MKAERVGLQNLNDGFEGIDRLARASEMTARLRLLSHRQGHE